MRFAVISDIESNLPAMRSVLAAIDGLEPSVDRIVCAGDVVGLGPNPNEVVELLRERFIETVRGNYDDAVAFDRLNSGSDFPDVESEEADRLALSWTRSALSPENMQFVRDLPRDAVLYQIGSRVGFKPDEEESRMSEYRGNLMQRAVFGNLVKSRRRRIPGRKVSLVHGSPRALNEFIQPDSANSILAAINKDVRADVIVSGHAGTSFQRVADGTTFIGVGSVSGARTRPGEAEYAIVEVAAEIETEFGRAYYDAESYAQDVLRAGLPSAVAARPGLHSL